MSYQREEKKDAYLSGECDAKQIERCKQITGKECEIQNKNDCPRGIWENNDSDDPFCVNYKFRGNTIHIPIKTYLCNIQRIKKKVDNIPSKQTRTFLCKLYRLLDKTLGLEIIEELLNKNAVMWPLFHDKYPGANYNQFHTILRQLEPIIESKVVNDKRVIDGHRPPKIYLPYWHEPEDFLECQKRYLEYKRHEIESEREYRRKHREKQIKELREKDENQRRLREATLEWEKKKQQIIARKKAAGEDQ